MGEEADYLAEWDDEDYDEVREVRSRSSTPPKAQVKKAQKRQAQKASGRYRCLITGCNPVLKSVESAEAHKTATGHRTASWPVRSVAGTKKAIERNRTGYYDKYNVGAKSAEARGIR